MFGFSLVFLIYCPIFVRPIFFDIMINYSSLKGRNPMNHLKYQEPVNQARKPAQRFAETYASSYSSNDQDDLNDYSDEYLKSQNGYDHEEEDYQLEEDYVMKLKTQRQRIEKMEKATIEKDQLLLKQVQRSRQLVEEVENMSHYVPYKQKFEDMVIEKQELERQYDKMFNQLKNVKEELSDVVREGSNRTQKLKREIHELSLQNKEIVHEYEERLSEKCDQIKNLKGMLKNIEMQRQKQVKVLKGEHEKLVAKLEDAVYTLQRQCSRFKQQIKTRDQIIGQLEKNLENSKKHHIELKTSMQHYSQQVQQREKQLYKQINRLKHNLSQSKKSSQQLKTDNHNLEHLNKKLQEDKQDLCSNYDELKADFRRANQIFEATIKKKQYQFSQQIKHSNLFIEQLKSSIEELMEVKNSVLTQNRKLVTILKRKEDIERQRKQILKTEFKEINRIEKVIDRLE